MADCTTKIVIENEEYWARWKENKCTNFERPKVVSLFYYLCYQMFSSKIVEGKKRDDKKIVKIAGLCGPIVKA